MMYIPEMLYSDQNAFERETYLLETAETRQEILLIFEAAEYMAESNWVNAIVKIKKYRQLVEEVKESKSGLQREVKLMESFCLFHFLVLTQDVNQAKCSFSSQYFPITFQLNLIIEQSGRSLINFNLAEEKSLGSQQSFHSSKNSQNQKIQKSLAVRALTFAATIIINSQNSELDYKDIRDRLVSIFKTKEMNLYLPQVLGTLTGCKYFQPLVALKDVPGIHSPTLARKLQLIADWKYIAGLSQEAIEFKRRAQNLWQLLNCRNEFMQCQIQLKDLQTKKNSPYFKRLSRIKVFVDPLLKIQAPQLPNNKQTLVKWKIPTLIDEILPPPTQLKSKKQMGFSESKVQKEDQKKSFLKDIVAMATRFYKVYKQEINSQSTSLMHNSKFLEEQILIVRKKLLILVRLRSRRLRDSWSKIQLVAFPVKPVLNSGVLQEKRSIYF